MKEVLVRSEKIGVVIPTYKESENIAKLVAELIRLLPGVEVAVVDDSPDLSTVEALEKANFSQVTALHRSAKGGRGSAVIEGMRILVNKGCEKIVEMDADFSHPPTQIPELLDHL